MKKGVLVALVIVCCAAGMVRAEDPHHDRPMIGHFGELGLTDEQRAKFKEINKSYENKYKEYKDRLEPMHKELKAEESKEKLDTGRIRSILNSMAPIQTDLRVTHIQHFHELRTVLTPEQKEKLERLHSDHPRPKPRDRRPHRDDH